MQIIRDRGKNILCPVVLIVLLLTILLTGPSRIFIIATAEYKEFGVEKFDENITISANALQAIDINIQKGEEIEVVFTLQVKESLPIDIWFVNEDHYTLLINGAQFLYLIDGSEQQVSYTKKIVTLKEHDIYKLVVTNYENNQTIEVNLIYEIRTYCAESGETSSNDLSAFLVPLSFLVIILIIVLTVLLIKVRGYKQKLERISRKVPSKKKNLRKSKKHKSKEKQKTSSKKSETHKPKEAEPEITHKASPGFCGHCGTPITTPFCTNCGRKV